MEVFLGAVLTLGIIIVGNLMLRKPVEQLVRSGLRYSQSHVYTLTAGLPDYLLESKNNEIKTQSKAYVEKSYVRVVIAENNAYWIKDNALFVADIEDGFVVKESTRRVDTMSMDKVELEKTMAIVEKLREGLDEDSGTGKQ